MSSFPEFSVSKTVPLKFSGVDLKLKTSHGLFSSHHIDEGTMLLLKTLAQQKSIPETGRVLDAGCGTGPLALALKKFRPALTVVARDRLALAVAFTLENARLNKVEVEAAAGLLLEDPLDPFDLVVSNVPAKAGEPVLADFVRRSLGLLTDSGLAAVVLVEPLAEWWKAELDKAGALVVYQESAPGYRVFHYQAGPSCAAVTEPSFPSAYRRGEVNWSVGTRTFRQTTVFGLPNFDALDYRLQVTLPLLELLKPRGDAVVWEPVQGHLATWVDALLPSNSTLHLAGNDALGVATARLNVNRRAVVHAVPYPLDLEIGPGSIDLALVQLHPEPEIPWTDDAVSALLRWLAPGGQALVNGSSTDVTRFLERHKGLRKLHDNRSKGWRAVVLERLLP